MVQTIKKEEILDYFMSIHSNRLLDILEKIKRHCYDNGIPILNNPTNKMEPDFVDLIMDCLDINLIFTKNNKLNIS